ncbi:helix-turn-helix domain-containing protein [Motilimonas cestriensis]|uniref:helix-turn-helix domain-containing protein n=1 Tax=Motilimonas cestriensis TaxID=2742685 RepID=UPI003DA29B52
MITWKHQIESIKHLVDWVWYLEVKQGESMAFMPQLIPNVNAHYIITPSTQTYDYQNKVSHFVGTGSHLITPSTQTLILNDDAPLTRLGIRFTPTALYQLQQQESGVIDQCLELDWLAHLLSSSDYQSLIVEGEKAAILERVEQDLQPLMKSVQRDRSVILVEKALALIEQHNGLFTSDNLAQQCFTTKRTLERAFKKTVGIGIKQYQSIVKFEALFMHLHQQPNKANWAEMASQFGFSDQPHLIRQMKQIIGVTPSGYLNARDLVIDAYGDFE